MTQFSAHLFQYLPIVLFIMATIAFAVATLVISYYLQPRLPHKEKLDPYECGSDPISDARMPYPVRYYIIAMLFVIFDIEVIFLYPWAVAFFKLKFLGFLEMMIFIALFLAGYIYAWRKGALEWD
ncbi:MAG TPA: NADH-quinone oxidoreductase subunit A [Nitrospiria bacterium]|nr:NADH-quinone oxidoreductase subunit A [Nitrospiria bacterium]